MKGFVFNIQRPRLPLLMPLIAIIAVTLPLLAYQLPNYKSTLTEEYQPFKTLKFISSHGQQFHKWGPVDNFVLAPGFAATFGYWKLTGKFSHGSSEFPYGLADPLHQISTLILQSRLVFLSLALLAIFTYTRALSRLAVLVIKSPGELPAESARTTWAAPLAVLLVIATNPVLLFHLVALKPDTVMISFSCLALASYLAILTDGLTIRRAIFFGIWAAIAVSAKESALPLLALPAAYLLIPRRFLSTPAADPAINWRLSPRLALAAPGILTYGMVSVIYAPHTWIERMKFWFGGPGMATDVWASSDATFTSRLLAKIIILWDNLGPAGSLVALAALLFFVIAPVTFNAPRTPWPRIALVLPVIGFAAALLKIGYAPDYFAHPMSLAIAPIVTVALARFLATAGAKPWWRYDILAAAILINFYYAQIAWLLPYQSPEVLIERDLATLPPDHSFNLYSLYAGPPRTRLESLGFAQDTRPMAQLVADGPQKLPDYLYQSDEDARWLADFPNRPERAAMVKNETQFDFTQFPGLSAWGYSEVKTLTPHLPAWYPFTFMPISKTSTVIHLYARTNR